jgi:hypothetical protein
MKGEARFREMEIVSIRHRGISEGVGVIAAAGKAARAVSRCVHSCHER